MAIRQIDHFLCTAQRLHRNVKRFADRAPTRGAPPSIMQSNPLQRPRRGPDGTVRGQRMGRWSAGIPWRQPRGKDLRFFEQPCSNLAHARSSSARGKLTAFRSGSAAHFSATAPGSYHWPAEGHVRTAQRVPPGAAPRIASARGASASRSPPWHPRRPSSEAAAPQRGGRA